MKIRINDTVKRAKEFGSGNGIEITLPPLNDTKFNIYAIELAIFEKTQGSNIWKIYKDKNNIESKKRMIYEPASLKIQMDFGNVTDYRIGAKYKIGYRYYAQCIEDTSLIVVAGQDIKDGWRLAGESNPGVATEEGFVFYPNTNPELHIESIQFYAEEIDGLKTFEYSVETIESIWLPKNVFENGIKLNFTATDGDPEDNLTASYTLINPNDGSVISQGVYSPDNMIISNNICEYVQLVVSVMDNWGAQSEVEKIMLKIDQSSPEVIDEFDDKGKMIRGRNLYSKFTINDSPGEPLSQGKVYYSVVCNDRILYKDITLPNDPTGVYTVDLANVPDGEYDIILTLFDKAHNKTIHTLRQNLDNTPPSVTFLTPEQNMNATLYSTWMNTSKQIIVSVADYGAGIKSSQRYLNNAWNGSNTFRVIPNEHTYTFNVETNQTGKLYYYYYFYDDAFAVDKSNNTINTSLKGNSTFISRYVWLDKTPPTVNINSNEAWYEAPSTIDIIAYDYPSDPGVSDSSGVKSISYCITDGEEQGEDWLLCPESGVTFNAGGVYYLHVKAEDFAGNISIESKKIKVNNKSLLLSGVSPTDNYAHTIYNRTNYNGKSVYITKNTAYNTQYHFSLQDDDISDTIITNISLINIDNAGICSELQVTTPPTGSAIRDIVFNVPYISEDSSALPDGIYRMLLTISEVKNGGEQITTHSDIIGCEVVIKRTSPPVPQITVSDVSGEKRVSIQYPAETLSDSLNSTYISSLYKREYKAVEKGIVESNAYHPYTAPLFPVIKNCVVTALYTDCAGNASSASLRVLSDEEGGSESIQTDGDTAFVEEGRSSTTYYIGIRREKQSGINSSVFDFMQ